MIHFIIRRTGPEYPYKKKEVYLLLYSSFKLKIRENTFNICMYFTEILKMTLFFLVYLTETFFLNRKV